jgi:hypothetical protein
VGHDQLVRVALLLREWRSRLNALSRVGNCAIERGPASPQPKRRHHQTRVTEHGLRLNQPLTFHSAEQPVGVDVDVAECKSCGVAQSNAVLILRLVVAEAFRVFFYDEPTRTTGRVGQDCVGVSNSAVADPLLGSVDLVADDPAVLGDPVRGGLQRSQIAAGFRLSRAVGEQQSLFRDARQPVLLLLRSGAHGYWVAAEKCRQHSRGNAQINARHLFTDQIHIEGAAAETAAVLGDEQQLNAQLVRAAHVPDDVQGAFVAFIQLE